MTKVKWEYGIHYYTGSLEQVVDELCMTYQNAEVIQIIASNTKAEFSVVYRQKIQTLKEGSAKEAQYKSMVEELLNRATFIISHNGITSTVKGAMYDDAIELIKEVKQFLGK